MRLIITTILLSCLVLACADNPLNLAEGQWVRNKLDGQKYYTTDHGGFVRVKKEVESDHK